jgi:hypothetical protein
MFPNVRMMVVATLASIVAVICGMGVLAAIGINHEPFTRLPGDRPPLQIVFDHTVPGGKAVEPFGVRFQVGAQPNADDEAAKSAPVAVPAPTADATAKETVADTKSAPDVATPIATKPPASAVANSTPVHRRRIVHRVSTQFADRTVPQQQFQWSQPAAQTTRPATGAISRAVTDKTLSNTRAAELPTPTIP